MNKVIDENPGVSRDTPKSILTLKMKDLLIFLPILTAGLYYLGSIYHSSNLWQFGIEESMFVLPFERSLLLGLFPFVISMGDYMVKVSIALFATTMSSFIFAIILPRLLSDSAKLTGQDGKQSKRSGARVNENFMALWRLIFVAASALFACALLAISAHIASKVGRLQAMDSMNSFSRNETSSVLLYSDKLPAPVKAMQIRCGEKYCAFWLGDKALMLKYEDIQKIEGYPPSSMGAPTGSKK